MLGLKIVDIILVTAAVLGGSVTNLDYGYYPDTAVVTNVDYENDIIEVTGFNGNCWTFEGVEDWYEGDLCSIIFCDMGTEVVTDDIIIETKYSGWVDDDTLRVLQSGGF